MRSCTLRSTSEKEKKQTIRKDIVRLALPNIISNITVPLLSLVDVGLAGHLPSSESIGAIAIASGAMNTLFWLFSFLRMGTTGYVAQAYGKGDVRELALFFVRGLALALPIGLVLLFAKPLVIQFAEIMAQRELDIAREAGNYLSIALWGAPATMLLFVLNGWFIGMQNSRAPMAAAITINIINIAVSYSLVRYGKMGVEGLALGTIAAQYIGVTLLIAIALIKYKSTLRQAKAEDLYSRYKLKDFLLTGKDVFFRSLMISSVTLYFTYASVREGELVVAANTLLLQLFTLFSYFTDGFAYAGEALAGRFLGMKDENRLRQLIRELFVIGFCLALATGLLYLFFPQYILVVLSDKSSIIDIALRYRYWIALVPIAGFSAFLWDGIFVGVTFSKGLMRSVLVATVLFFMVYFTFRDIWGNDALWLSFVVYLGARGAVQVFLWRKRSRTLLQ